jgi:hypothetical protein
MNASRLAVHDVDDENQLYDYRMSLRLHDLSQVTQLLRSPREPSNKPPPFRTYVRQEAPRVPMNRPTEAKPPAVISTYDELKTAALDRESEHNQKVERVRRMMMDMTTGVAPPPRPLLQSPSSTFPSSSPSALSFSSTVRPSPSKHKTKSSTVEEAPNLLKEYEMVEDLRALLPLFSGSIAEKSPAARSKFVPSKSPNSPSVNPLPALTLSVAPASPIALNTYSLSSLRHPFSNSSCVNASTGHALTVVAPSTAMFTPASHAIIEQYHRSIGQGELTHSPRSFQSPSDACHPHLECAVPSPPPPRPVRDSFEARVAFEPKTEDELLYEEELNRHKTGTVITANPFEALGLPSTLVYRSTKEGSGAKLILKPHPPSTVSPSKGHPSVGRRPIQAAQRESLGL